MSAEFNPTPEQRAAMTLRGGAILVSAAAGSGKTKVLVERLLGYLTDPERPADVGDFLIITYTRAAAAELRAKILQKITEELARDPQNRHLRRQSAMCAGAHIGTIHSFCTELIRENAQLLDISPDFRVSDEQESALIKAAVLEDVLGARYEAMTDGDGFSALADALSAGRDDSRLAETALDAHAKLQSHHDPRAWIETRLKTLDVSELDDAADTVWGRFLLEKARSAAVFWRARIDETVKQIWNVPEVEAAYRDGYIEVRKQIDAFISATFAGWDAATDASYIFFPRAKALKGHEEYKALREKCKKGVAALGDSLVIPSGELLADTAAVAPIVEALFALVLDFDDAYTAEKRRRGVIDFSDQEHLAARLLTDGAGAPTELARAVQNRYIEIMADEYQDVNAVQERIFRAVSRAGENIFMVGDVKQSIYRFRLADPSIFLDKYARFADGDGGRRILLSQNFRSRAAVLDAVNFVFTNIMSKEFGEMDYGEAEMLLPGRSDASGGAAVELDVLDMSGREDDDGDSPSKTRCEAAFIARRIEELVGTLEIPAEDGGTRRAEYEDVVILLRSVKDRTYLYASALAARGIPVETAGGARFFETTEIAVAMSLLEIIDNPMQDVPLISVLRSPLYAFTADELAKVRGTDRDADFYTALRKTAETDEKCRAFLEELDGFRTLAPDLPADKLLWRVYNATGLLGAAGAMSKGAARRANLMTLIEAAQRAESGGYKGLFGFVSYLRRLRERDMEPGERGGSEPGNAVRIMSIHKSKGLEFPVVFLADTTKRFNSADAGKPLLLHAELGAGVKRVDLRRRIEYPTLPRIAVGEKMREETMAEELRVLYVAMTRAREKLVLVCTYGDALKELEKLRADASLPVPPQILSGKRDLASMLLLPALARPEARALFGDPAMLENGAWDMRLLPAPSPEASARRADAVEETPEADAADVAAIAEKLEFRYGHSDAAELPSKLTVTELKGRLLELEASEDAETLLPRAPAPFARPSFVIEKSALSAAERGTALHLVMQYIDYDACADEAAVRAAIGGLVEKQLVTPAQGDAADASKIAAFFASELGKRVRSTAAKYREFKFSLLTPARELLPNDCGDEILFQGVADCVLAEDGELTIVDFKTDRVTEDTLPEKIAAYTPQLDAYSRALTRVTGLPVAQRALYFFDINRAVFV